MCYKLSFFHPLLLHLGPYNTNTWIMRIFALSLVLAAVYSMQIVDAQPPAEPDSGNVLCSKLVSGELDGFTRSIMEDLCHNGAQGPGLF